jgi:hypothetical protein
MSHPKDVIGLLDELAREHSAALAGNIDLQFAQSAHRVSAGRLAVNCADPGRKDAEVAFASNSMTEQALGHGAATNVTSADEQNGLHPSDAFAKAKSRR